MNADRERELIARYEGFNEKKQERVRERAHEKGVSVVELLDAREKRWQAARRLVRVAWALAFSLGPKATIALADGVLTPKEAGELTEAFLAELQPFMNDEEDG